MEISSDQKYNDVIRADKAIEAAGIADIQFRPAGSSMEAKLDKPVSLVVSEKPLAEVINPCGPRPERTSYSTMSRSSAKAGLDSRLSP